MARKSFWMAISLAVVCGVVWTSVCGARDVVGDSQEDARHPRMVQPGGIPQGLKPSEWGNIRERIHEAEYQYAWHTPSEACVAPNRTHGWQTALGTAGLRLEPGFSQTSAGWALGLRLAAWGSPGDLRPVSGEPVQAMDGRRVTYRWDEGLTEWYINDSRGIEQGFTIQSPPAGVGGDGGPVLEMSLDTRLSPRLSADGKAVVFNDSSGRTVLRYADLHVTDSSGRVLPSHLELLPPLISPLCASRLVHHGILITPAHGVEQEARIEWSKIGACAIYCMKMVAILCVPGGEAHDENGRRFV
jgi:hypothetical protein